MKVCGSFSILGTRFFLEVEPSEFEHGKTPQSHCNLQVILQVLLTAQSHWPLALICLTLLRSESVLLHFKTVLPHFASF